MTKGELIDLLLRASDIPDEAEVRVETNCDEDFRVNIVAIAVRGESCEIVGCLVPDMEGLWEAGWAERGLAEFERHLIAARAGEGRKRARARGVLFGRARKLTPRRCRRLPTRCCRGSENMFVPERHACKPYVANDPMRKLGRTFKLAHAAGLPYTDVSDSLEMNLWLLRARSQPVFSRSW